MYREQTPHTLILKENLHTVNAVLVYKNGIEKIRKAKAIHISEVQWEKISLVLCIC